MHFLLKIKYVLPQNTVYTPFTFFHILVNYQMVKRKLVYLLLICLSFFIFRVAFHHHNDGVSHNNCPICSYASRDLDLVFQDSPQISIPSRNVLHIPLEDEINVSNLYYHSYSSRAPPA